MDVNEKQRLKKLFSGLRCLANDKRWEIALLLNDKGCLSFSQIREILLESHSKDVIWLSLESMKKNGIVDDEKKFKKTSGPGKPQNTFYTLTKKGTVLVNYLEKVIEETK